MYDALTIARYIINYSNKQGYGVTNLKLQKLLYFVQAAFLKIYENACFKEDMQAWDMGPVVPGVYHEFKRYGNRNIPTITEYAGIGYEFSGKKTVYDDSVIAKDHKEVIEFIVELFKNHDASTLVEITHRQKAWRNAYVQWKNNPLDLADLKDVF